MTALPFRVVVITDWAVPDLLERARAIARAVGGVAFQHRHPGASDRTFYEEGLLLREAIGAAPLFVNRRVDVALALEAHLHLTERSLPVDAARRALPRERLVSASWHADLPRREGVDLLLLSPIFAPQSKPADRPALGVERFHQLAATAGVPVFALGGMTAERTAELRPGTSGVAAIGTVWSASDPAAAVRGLLVALRS